MVALALALLAAGASAAVSNATACSQQVAVVSALHKVRDFEPWCGPTITQFAAAQNEYESIQVVVNRPSSAVHDVALRFTSGPAIGVAKLNERNSTLLHRVHFIDIAKASDCDGGRGRWPDALVPKVDPWFNEPRNALPASLDDTNSSLLLFWLDVFINPDVPPGNYSATVVVCFDDASECSSDNGTDQEAVAVPLTLRVFGFRLDSTSKVYKSTYGVSSDGILMAAYGKDWKNHLDQRVNLTQRYMQLGLMHRLSFTHGGLPDPALAQSPVDWQGFESRWGDYVGEGVDLPFGLRGAAFTAVEVSTSSPLNAQFYAHAKKRGWDHKLASKVCDEPSSPAEWAGCASTCASVHAGTPSALCEVTTTVEQLKTANQSLGKITPKEVGIFTALINFIENSAEHCSDFPTWSFQNTRGEYDAWMAENPAKELWMYQSCMSEGCDPGIDLSLGCDKVPAHKHWPCESGWPSLMIDAPAIMNRIFPTLGYHYNASGELYWQTNFADTCTRENVVGNCPVSELPPGQWAMDAWTDQLIMGGNGDGNLLYPGTKDRVGGDGFIPIASIRLKHLRDGMEDNAYLHMLEAAKDKDAGSGSSGRQQVMALLKKVVTNAFTYTRDVELWEQTRVEIGRQLEAA